MEYLCLVYFEPAIFERMTDAEKKKLDRDSIAYDKLLMKKGNFIDARALDSALKAVTVKVRGSKCRRPTARSPRPRSILAASS